MSLIEQRNRFLSFAFASADVLIETDEAGQICFAAGATAALGEPSIETSKEMLESRLDRTSRPIFNALRRSIRPGRRVGPSRVTISGREARLSGWQLGDDASIRWAVSFEALSAPADVEPEALERSAEGALTAAREAGTPMAMSVMRLDDAADLERQLGKSRADQVMKAVIAAAELAVGETGVARQVDPARFALIHSRKAKLDQLIADVDAILAENDLTGAHARIESVPDSPELEPEMAVQAFLHAVHQAADSEAVLDVRSLKDVAAEMMEETQRRINELKTTIAGRVFETYAQPIIELETGKIHHYEALLRLPGGKPLEDNVSFAESTGLILEIDFAMTEIAATFLRDDYDRPSLAVNLSGRSLATPAWGKKFLAMIAELKIDRSRLSFELTETATITNIKAANAVIQKLRERGHKVCLDDFGAGAAGFQYLRDFPADIVKIDGAYIAKAGSTERDATLLKGMIRLCADMGTETVAEFVESKDRAELMKSLGVTYGQGYYFGKPVPLKTLSDPRNNASRAA
jgi:EAL domain-containing protein (putative c-di-GMP-specific phosphodiesterase class I)